MKIEGRVSMPAHRAYYMKHRGPIPTGLHLDHLCGVKRCVNPAHLEPVTPAVNARRAPRTRLTLDSVAEIRSLVLAGVQQKDVARRFGVARSHISKIVAGRKWA
jgi:hypothetical protein